MYIEIELLKRCISLKKSYKDRIINRIISGYHFSNFNSTGNTIKIIHYIL